MSKKEILISFLATLVQVYDYALFGHAILFLTEAYIAPAGTTHPIVRAFIVLGATSLAKPLGSILYGITGDYYSRKVVIRTAALLSLCSVLAIGLIPPYQQIGLVASLVFFLFRSLFMMSLVGETDGVRVYVLENVTPTRRNFAQGVIASCHQLGAQAAVVAVWIARISPCPYAWRLCFIVGGLLGFVVFTQSNALKAHTPPPATKTITQCIQSGQLLVHYWKLLVPCILIQGCLGAIYSFQLYFFPIYVTQTRQLIQETTMRGIVVLTLGLYTIVAPLAGYLADRWGRHYPTMLAAVLISIICSILHIRCIQTQQFLPILYSVPILLLPFYSIPLQVKVCTVFPQQARLRLFSLSHSIGSVLLSAQISTLAAVVDSQCPHVSPIVLYIGVFCILVCSVMGVQARLQEQAQ